MRFIFVLAGLLTCLAVHAAELRLDFSDVTPGKMPPGFRNLLAGEGKPGDWQVIMDDVPPILAPLTTQAPSVTRRAVLAQMAKDPTDEHFPMLVLDRETFADFTITTRFKIVSGATDAMAGIAFRVQDERNFYVIRASALGHNLRFYKVVAGIRSDPIGPTVDIHTGDWHELQITCKGNEIRAALDGKDAIPPLQDTSFNSGKIAFWTKSDSVSYFTDTVINYKPVIPLAQTLVTEMMKKYPRILALRIYTLDPATKTCRVLASKEASELGEAGGKYEEATLESGKVYYAKAKDHVEMVMPLRDRNGDIAAAVRLHLTTFPGQTEQNALARATPIVKEMQAKVQTAKELAE